MSNRKDIPVFSGVFIPLTQGQSTIVDEEDYLLTLKYKWCAWYNKSSKSFYAKAYAITESGKKSVITLHRYLTKASGRPQCVDHINGNTLDNRQNNLRVCSPAENNKNRTKPHPKSTSGYRGVCWVKSKNKYKAYISLNNKHKHLGYYNNPEDAARAFNKAAIVVYGDFKGALNNV